ncbi:MAG: helix-turn-helix domain-containing protein [Ferruginibacter sp.]
MQTTNPFDLILSRLEQLQSSVNILSENAQKNTPALQADPDRLLDLSEASEVMRKPIGTVRHYIDNRNLPAIKIGKSYLIKLNELLSWVNTFKDDNDNEREKSAIDPMLANRKRYSKHKIDLLPGKK